MNLEKSPLKPRKLWRHRDETMFGVFLPSNLLFTIFKEGKTLVKRDECE